MADTSLHCNWLKCRKPLLVEGKAVVTTCSHIFCLSCAEQLFVGDNQCPACKTELRTQDDVVLSQLIPSPEYRTSVLAGLSPDIVMDIAGRSLTFWQYQVSQEAAFQSMILKSAQERNSSLDKRFQSFVIEANGEINLLKEKIASLDKDLATERRKARGLQESLRAVSKEYENLKARVGDHEQQRQQRAGGGGGGGLYGTRLHTSSAVSPPPLRGPTPLGTAVGAGVQPSGPVPYLASQPGSSHRTRFAAPMAVRGGTSGSASYDNHHGQLSPPGGGRFTPMGSRGGTAISAGGGGGGVGGAHLGASVFGQVPTASTVGRPSGGGGGPGAGGGGGLLMTPSRRGTAGSGSMQHGYGLDRSVSMGTPRR